MPRHRDNLKCFPCRKSGFSCQPEFLDETDVSCVLDKSNLEDKDMCVLQVRQTNHENSLQHHDHNHAHNSSFSDRSNCTPTVTSWSDAESKSTLQPRSIASRSFTDGNSPAVSPSDLEKCRQALRKTFRDCDKAEFRLVACLISCVLSCARWFSRHEVLAATTLFDPDRISKTPERVRQQPQEEYWLRKCNPIIMETLEGSVTFRSRAMGFLLRSFRIRGVDTSHRTLALICRNQIELDKRFARDATSLIDQPGTLRAVQVFSPYVAAFGHHHLKFASLTSMIPTGEEGQPLSTAKNSGNRANNEFEIIQMGTKQLSLAEEVGDWVLLEPTLTAGSSPL